MIDVPGDVNGRGSDIGKGWYVLPRPEGKRCLVIASKYGSDVMRFVFTTIILHSGQTIARIQSGSILKRFSSELPNGTIALSNAK